ncbi:hypothetical protein EDB81DRAFT_883809 [Dactylonectria macrodidyma]|uniref:Mid2 domain-containing protein n=1 Tax=Dactylonectria macrodidyma TaxID=307937 RepID=A0A9P9J8M6_9HYPO|nr:hypothetical protein EDB81DRAFT_883809 [Dactylonectria macrodidyma]
MQLKRLLFLGLLLGAEGTRVVRRQGSHDDAHIDRRQLDSNTDSATGGDDSTTDAVISSSSSPPIDEVTTSTSADQITTTTADEVTTTSSSEEAGDTTINQTVTVTDDDASAITKKTTVQKTVVSTVVVTSTLFETKTVTSEGETSTSTVYSTTTVWANERRALNLAPRTVDSDGYVVVDAMPTGVTEVAQDEQHDLKALLRRKHLAERALVTKVVTVTVGGNAKTTTQTVTQTVISSTSSVKKSTSTVTETEVSGASTTITTTSVLTITSTRVTTGVVVTSTGTSSDSDSSNDSSNDSSSSSSSSSGLSTGAKAGIGAGAGVVALAALGVILWCCLKRRNKPSKSEIDDMFGSSEVPVGGVRNTTTSPHMSQANHGVESGLAPNRMATKSEGYRGTAIGDGRTGYAKPAPYGAAYNNAVSPETAYSRTATASPGREDRLPLHPSAAEMDSPANTAELGNDNVAAEKWHNNNAAEIDSHPVTSPRPAAPAEHVYEMPAQPYR